VVDVVWWSELGGAARDVVWWSVVGSSWLVGWLDVVRLVARSVA